MLGMSSSCFGRDVKKILFVVNAPEFFLSHRLPIALAASQLGYQVHVATASGEATPEIQRHGFSHHEIPFARSGQNPIFELFSIVCLFRLFRSLKPDLVHLVTIKPVLYGGIVARLARIKSVVAAVSGLGTVFMAQSLFAKIRRSLVIRLYRSAFSNKKIKVIFQNPDDREVFLALGLVRLDQTVMIRGSGVNLSDYPCTSEPIGKVVVTMAARLLRDKGVLEFVQAARLLRERAVDVEMRLIGSPDLGNPTSITQAELDGWMDEAIVKILGFRKDIAQQFSMSNIVCLPSYREGLPKTLVEAAACGRAVITTDVPGCRDAITVGVTGLLVPVKNSLALAMAIEELAINYRRRNQMGAEGRQLAEAAFCIEKIVEQHLRIYRELIGNG